MRADSVGTTGLLAEEFEISFFENPLVAVRSVKWQRRGKPRDLINETKIDDAREKKKVGIASQVLLFAIFTRGKFDTLQFDGWIAQQQASGRNCDYNVARLNGYFWGQTRP